MMIYDRISNEKNKEKDSNVMGQMLHICLLLFNLLLLLFEELK